ncbi:hypothetical protein ACIRG5_28255 [Lentzea sp. NPDC102401]|uniref:hypothetical protein n=1 Tax=Lentzea sp. NPDC102401 TaxID=3364128 RepID=UPI003809930D
MTNETRAFQPSSAQSQNHDHRDALERLDETTDALAALRDAITGEEPLDDALQQLAETAPKRHPTRTL